MLCGALPVAYSGCASPGLTRSTGAAAEDGVTWSDDSGCAVQAWGICCSQVAQLQGEAREVVHLRGQLADKESEVAGLRAHLEEALREELADSDPARLRAAQKRAAALEADLAAKQVLR